MYLCRFVVGYLLNVQCTYMGECFVDPCLFNEGVYHSQQEEWIQSHCLTKNVSIIMTHTTMICFCPARYRYIFLTTKLLEDKPRCVPTWLNWNVLHSVSKLLAMMIMIDWGSACSFPHPTTDNRKMKIELTQCTKKKKNKINHAYIPCIGANELCFMVWCSENGFSIANLSSRNQIIHVSSKT